MIELIPGLPDAVVGVVASGQVTAHDYETVLIPAIELRTVAHEKVSVLYQLGPAFTGFTAGAMWDDLKLGAAHMRAWQKLAVVTDVEWIAGAARLFGFGMPCPVRVFANRELDEAKRWISAG